MAEVVCPVPTRPGPDRGVRGFAETLRNTGHTVHTPDLYQGRTFDTLDEGIEYARSVGFGEVHQRGLRAAADLPEGLVRAGFSLGVTPARQLAQTRAGAGRALLLESCVPPEEFGGGLAGGGTGPGPRLDQDPIFAGEGDLDAARALVAATEDAELFLYAATVTCSPTRASRRTTPRPHRCSPNASSPSSPPADPPPLTPPSP